MQKRTVFKIAGAVVASVAVVVIAAVAYVATNANEYKGVVVNLVQDVTGRELELGDLSLVPALQPTVAVSDVRFANAEWGSEPDMVTAKRAEVRFDLFNLLSGKLTVEDLTLVQPDILLETDAQGRGNWELGAAAVEQVEQASDDAVEAGGFVVGLLELAISGARLRFLDGATGETIKLVVDELSAWADDTSSPLAVKTVAEYNDIPISIEATLGALQALLGNEPYPVEMSVEAAGALVTAKGAIERPMEGAGLSLDINAKAASLASLSDLAGAELPPLGPLEVAGRVSDGEGVYRLEDLKATIGGSDVSGELSVLLTGDRPKLSAQFVSTHLDLTDLTGTTKSTAPQPAGKNTGRVFSPDPLPFEALRGFDADVSFKVGRLTTPKMSAEQLDLQVLLDNGHLTLKPVMAQVAGGSINAGLVVDAGSTPAGLTLNVKGSQIDLGRLLKEAGGKDVLTGGGTDVSIDLSGQGDSIQALAAGLNGKVLVVTGSGQIRNKLIDFAGANVTTQILGTLNPLAKQSDFTSMVCAVVRYDIQNGLANSDRGIAFETDKMAILGAGTINLKNEELSLLIESKAKDDAAGLAVTALTRGRSVSLAGLVQVGGTLSAPEIQLNPEGLLKQGVTASVAVATGGLSELAKGLLDQSGPAVQSPCQTAQQKTSPSAGGNSEPEQTKQATDGGSKEAASEGAEKKGGVGGLLKGILGN